MTQESNIIPLQAGPVMRTKTLAELGAQLPHGTLGVSGQVERSIAARRWNLKAEKRLAKLRDEHKGNGARHASIVLAVMCERLGGFVSSGQDKSIAQDIVEVEKLSMADVLYAFVYLRRECVASEYDHPYTCPRCGAKGVVTADLSTLEVKTIDSPTAALWDYDLKDPIVIRGVEVKQLLMGPPRWGAVARQQGAGGISDLTLAKTALIHDAIQGCGIDGIALTEDDFGEMSKRDLEHLTTELDKHMLGPVMSTAIKCSSCRHEYEEAIDWTYDRFFAISSR